MHRTLVQFGVSASATTVSGRRSEITSKLNPLLMANKHFDGNLIEFQDLCNGQSMSSVLKYVVAISTYIHSNLATVHMVFLAAILFTGQTHFMCFFEPLL